MVTKLLNKIKRNDNLVLIDYPMILFKKIRLTGLISVRDWRLHFVDLNIKENNIVDYILQNTFVVRNFSHTSDK
jgi:ribosome biogenesis GTPase A